MSLFLKEFSTHSEYDSYINGGDAILPNVSICTTEGDVHYNPYVDPCKQYDYVEIGGVKWATKNVGACDITDTGLYFQWGDTQGYTADQVGSGEGQKYFDSLHYKYSNEDGTVMTKYNSTDGKTVLDTSDDAATVNMGSGWRMPTKDEYVALGNAVNTAWTANYQDSGVAGMICTDKEDSSKVLFFPACGFCSDGSVKMAGIWGFYWSSLFLSSDTCYTAYHLYFEDGYVGWQNTFNRFEGFPVRAVVNE